MDYPEDLRLWPHQAEAVDTVAPFLDTHAGPPAPDRLSALVNIPTGGGKTAVIGILSHWHPRLDRVLVLAPRTAIRDQLVKELGARRGFFLRAGYQPDTLPKRVLALNSARDAPARLPADTIFLATIQLITDMASDPDRRTVYQRLREVCDAVIVDEGHYEPARSWSQVIRGLGRATVLVTATPYRNDLKAFEFDREALHISRYSDLTAAHILRPVDVLAADPHAANAPDTFVESVLRAFVGHYGQAPTSERKLIIRCRAREHIAQIGDLIRSHRLGAGGVLCLHENFANSPERPWEKRQPSDPETPDAPAIWIHQHKLLEGVDGPSFRALAFYGVLGSARALVQQIGRVVRNPTQDSGEHALMIDHSGGFLEGTWQRFLDYDTQIDRDNMLQGLDEIALAFDQRLPPVVYADRQFRRRLQLGANVEAELRRSLRLPLRCHIYNTLPYGGLDLLAQATCERLEEAEFPFQLITTTGDELLILFAKLQTSPLLADHYFVERELHAFVAQRCGRVIAVLDTSRPGLDQLALTAVGAPLARDQLARLLSRSPDTRLIEVTARNASLGPSAVRRRSATAASLEATPPALDEFQFVASSITAMDRARRASDEDNEPDEDWFSHRSVGFGRARITDAAKRATLDGWKAWTNRLVDAASDAARSKPRYLSRFANPLDQPPAKPWPRSVLLDLEEARQLFILNTVPGNEVDEARVEIDDVCLSCKRVAGQPGAPRGVRLIANGVVCTGTFEYLPNEQRYRLTSTHLERIYRYQEGPRPGNLVEYLNAAQAFVVVPDSANVIYSEGGFYNPRLKLGSAFDPDALGLSELIVTHLTLHACRSEKGGRGTATPATWANGSVFRWIDDNPDQLLLDADLILCDDGRRESCDFLLAGRRDDRDVIVIAHAKASTRQRYVSASALHDVCSQAAKQVGTLALFSPQQPAQVNLWGGCWDGPGGEGRVDHRLRRARGAWAGLTGPQIWARLQLLLERQNTDREVALVLGASLVRDRFFAQAERNSPPATAIHAMHLIRSTMSAVVGGGARLRVLCG